MMDICDRSIECDRRYFAPSAQNGEGTLHQWIEQLCLQSAIDCAEQSSHLGASLQHLSRRHSPVVHLCQSIGQQRMANARTEIAQDQL